jgi:hypothetical protein
MIYKRQINRRQGFLFVSIILCLGANFCLAQGDGNASRAVGDIVLADAPSHQNDSEASPPAHEDTQRYIDTDEITPGMRGYGLTVFFGTKIERFEVEAVSIMHNFEPKRDAIIIRVLDERFRLAKMVQGVSGSPVFFKDRMAGAMAFGWSFSEEPLYGVTPIRQMLQVRGGGAHIESDKTHIGAARQWVLDRHLYTDMMRKELLTVEQVRQIALEAGLAEGSASEYNHIGVSGMVHLPAAMTLGGFSGKTLEVLRQHIPGLLFQANLSGSGSSAKGESNAENITFQPGASLTVPLITGDMSGQVLGTVTEVIGDEVFAFGHPWNGEGPVDWPMATGYIHTFVSKKDASFKLGEAVKIIGAIKADEAPAIYGHIGAEVALTPVQIQVQWFDRDEPEVFNIQMAQNEQRGALLAVTVVLNSLMYRGGLPREHTINYQMEFQFDKIKPIRFENISSGVGTGDVFGDVIDPVMLVLGNPWQKVKFTGMKVKVKVSNYDNLWTIKSAQLNQLIFRPGDKVTAQLTMMPLRAQEKKHNVSLELPSDLEPGKYQVVIGSLDDYILQLRRAQPHKSRAFNVEDVQRILQERMSLPRNKIYISMTLPQPSIALENEELLDLPGSRTMLLTDKSRQIITTPFKRLLSAQADFEGVVLGAAAFDIEVRREY